MPNKIEPSRAHAPAQGAGGIDRRDVLKLGAATAAAVGAAGLRMGDSWSVSAAPGEGAFFRGVQDPETRVSKFKVDIDGDPLDPGAVLGVSVDPLAIDVREMTTGADWDYRVYGPGDAHYGSLTIRTRPGEDARALQTWFEEAAAGKPILKSVRFVMFAANGTPVRSWGFHECFPVRWDPGEYSPSSNVAFETITCKIGRVELA